GVKKVLLREATLLSDRQASIDAEVLRRYGLSHGQIGDLLAGRRVAIRGGRDLELRSLDLPLAVPGKTVLPGIGAIHAEISSPSPEPFLATEGVVDPGNSRGVWRVRVRRPGDRFIPLGMRGFKKLQDFFVDEGIPAARRDCIPLVCDGDSIVWVAGMRIDDRYKVTSSSSSVLRLWFQPA
ncbi:MAG: tRNA lysidine(34) synthetase TilS, partial [Chloroflexi bacterium]|nr:tRNA lysidine(34) synthetase TilS [Chloroflexota bacterium]